MEQPKEYKSEDELLKWLSYDLLEQIKAIAKNTSKQNTRIFLNNKDTIAHIEYNDLILNIGYKENFFLDLENKITTVIDFDFSINSILSKLKLYNNEIDIIVQCQKITFKKRVDFFNLNFNKVVTFISSTFEGESFFGNIHFNSIADFSNSNFNDNTIIHSFFNCPVYFNNSNFNCLVSFQYSTINSNSNLVNITFNNVADFFNFNINTKAHFDKINIKNKIVFEKIKIKDELLFSNIKLIDIEKVKPIENEKHEIIFDDLEFLDTNSLLQIRDCKDVFQNMSFRNLLINGRVDIQNIKTENADFLGSVINGGVLNTVNFKVNNFANRESALFLKNQAYIMHNNIDALQYKAKEMDIHRSNLKKLKKKSRENCAEILSMCLSKLSNNHGQDWIKAVFFTVLVPLLFFAIFYYPSINPFGVILRDIVKYFIPTNYDLLINYAEYNHLEYYTRGFGIFIYMLGKIAFGYGVVQVVQAFRKYNKY